MNALLVTAALLCGQFDQDLAIAIAINAPQPQQQSVVKDHLRDATKKVATPQTTTRQEIRYRYEWRQQCRNGRCHRYRVRVPYTVNVRVPAATTTNWPTYPTTPRANAWHQNGHAVTWQHLLTGEHARHNFDPAWLKSRSRAELEQLHNHSHTGRVEARFIVTRK